MKRKLMASLAGVTGALGLVMAALPAVATAQTVTSDQDQVTEQHKGMRPLWEDRGVTVEAKLTMDFMANFSGGIDRNSTILGNVDLTLEVDTGKAGFWKNGTFFLYILGNFNSNGFLTEIVGDLQTTSNIEADEALRIYEAWYEHRIANNTLSFLTGLHDYNSEFNALEYGALFINSSFGIEPDISQVGPSIFPLTALAARLKIEPNEHSYLVVAMYDGIPGDPDHPTHTAIKFDHDDGVFSAVEMGLTGGDGVGRGYYKIALGGWVHTAEVEGFDGSVHDDNSGVYLIGEKMLFAEDNFNDQGLGAFFQLGFADSHRNQVASYWGLGLHYTGLLPQRNQDIIGLAVASARNGRPFMQFSKAGAAGAVNHTETAIELSYRAEVTPWLIVQPDIQYVINPGMDPDLDNALVAGIRLELLW